MYSMSKLYPHLFYFHDSSSQQESPFSPFLVYVASVMMLMSKFDFESFNLAVSPRCLDFLAEEGVAVLFSPVCLITCEKQHQIDGYFQATKQPKKSDVRGNVLTYFSGHYKQFSLNCQTACDADLWFLYSGAVGSGKINDNVAYEFAKEVKEAVGNLPRVMRPTATKVECKFRSLVDKEAI